LKARTLALGTSLALVTFGGIASALIPHSSLASEHKALTSGAGQIPGNCITVPHACGFPDATNTGVPAGTTLKSVPGQVSSGPGWHYNAAGGYVQVTVNGAVLSGLYIPGNLDIEASDVTVKDVRVVTGGAFGISLRHTTGVTIENSTISGQNLTAGRVNAAISDVYGDSTAMVIKDNNISAFRIGIQMWTGLVQGNYLHDPGYIAGDHTDDIMAVGSTEPMTIQDNTVFNNIGQCYSISLDASGPGQAVASKTVTGNFIAGGDYTIYAGAGHGDPTTAILIQDNRFGQQYSPKSGDFGPVADYDPAGTGNTWTGNIWDTTGTPIPS
jgi:hypothetical protein